MNRYLPRILYLLAFLAWMMLLWPSPVTIFMAACFSCLTLPLYRHFRKRCILWRRNMLAHYRPSFVRGFVIKVSSGLPVFSYVLLILLTLIAPIAVLASLVSPQAMAGLQYLKDLRASNFQLPEHWVQFIHAKLRLLQEIPWLEKTLNDVYQNLDSMFSSFVSMLVSRSFGVVGSTMSALWLAFLFTTLTIIFSINARSIRKISCRILHVPLGLMGRYILAVRRALKGILLGVVLVALVQGILCGIGFAVAGVNQPAFWGMLATLVAPIPAVGTALVWVPLCVSLWFTGKTVAAAGLAIWGAVFVAGADNVLRPLFLRQGIKASFFVLILSILCGIVTFGAVGLIAGPILLAIAMQSVEEANHYYMKGA